MNVARILYPVRVLGPGDRIGVWVVGCHRACPGCSNPELWEQQPKYEISISDLLDIIRKIACQHPVDGFTISGGEPMNQAEELVDLVDSLQEISSDILVYSGYTLDDLRTSGSKAVQTVLSKIGVLIDGSYIEGLNDNSLLRGSSNQKIHILNPDFESRYRDYLQSTSNQIQNFTTSGGIISVGIHRAGFGRKRND